ncbi:Uma2 family endonuclease [Streptomyces sp. NPDC012623]|uniref:Uma2 family endonuclease n=1 Tax=unclassified Streptomyces TaxID=2593676 RepID=UPI003679A8A2
MTVEVTSHDRATDLRDRVEKRDGYAAAGIPGHLLVDREAQEVVVYTDPLKGAYKSRTSDQYYGDTVKLPDPVRITLETEKLKATSADHRPATARSRAYSRKAEGGIPSTDCWKECRPRSGRLIRWGRSPGRIRSPCHRPACRRPRGPRRPSRACRR